MKSMDLNGDLLHYLRKIREAGRDALESYDEEFSCHLSWLNTSLEEVKKGTVNINGPLVTKKTRGRKKGVLEPLNENVPDNLDIQQKDTPVSHQKRQSEEPVESSSKRIRAIKRVSTDSGFAGGSTGSQTLCNNVASVFVKEEVSTPNNSTSVVNPIPDSIKENISCFVPLERLSVDKVILQTRQSASQLGSLVVKNEKISPRCSIYVTPPNLRESSSTQKEPEAGQTDTSLPLLAPRSSAVPCEEQLKVSSSTPVPSTPIRTSRAKSRSLVKVDTEREPQPLENCSKDEDSPSSPLIPCQEASSNTVVDDTLYEQNQITPLPHLLKPFASASKIPQLFFKATTPLINRMGPLTPSFQRSNSFTASSSSKLVSGVQSFLLKPSANHEVVKSTNKEEDLQNLLAKAEAARKKKEETIKAKMEEKMRIREEKRLKVIAQREAKEREKMENKIKLEQMKEARLKQIQAEREEKIRQDNLKKKLLAEKKATENEERRRQEEAAKLAKFKQQEEDMKRAAALRRKEQEEAQRKQKERMQLEIEAAAQRVKESEVQATQALSKSKNLNNYSIADAGSDDSSEDEAQPKKTVPLWAQTKQRVPKLMEDHYISQTQIFLFFDSRKSTPDLSKIFTNIDRRRLMRKSSAVWRTPPKDKS